MVKANWIRANKTGSRSSKLIIDFPVVVFEEALFGLTEHIEYVLKLIFINLSGLLYFIELAQSYKYLSF